MPDRRQEKSTLKKMTGAAQEASSGGLVKTIEILWVSSATSRRHHSVTGLNCASLDHTDIWTGLMTSLCQLWRYCINIKCLKIYQIFNLNYNLNKKYTYVQYSSSLKVHFKKLFAVWWCKHPWTRLHLPFLLLFVAIKCTNTMSCCCNWIFFSLSTTPKK